MLYSQDSIEGLVSGLWYNTVGIGLRQSLLLLRDLWMIAFSLFGIFEVVG